MEGKNDASDSDESIIPCRRVVESDAAKPSSPFAPSECCDVHESAVVQETLLGTALWRFLLLLLLYFGCLRFNLTGSGERSVNFAHVDSVL